MNKRRLFLVAAAIPAVLFLGIFLFGLNDWYMITTHQLVVIPRPLKGQTSVPNMPASDLYPWIIATGTLTATFGYALWRRSKRALAGGYFLIFVIVAQAWIRHHL